MKSLDSMTSLLKTKSQDSSASEDGLIDAGGENLALCLGNVMKSSSSKAKYTNKDNNKNKVMSSFVRILASTKSTCILITR